MSAREVGQDVLVALAGYALGLVVVVVLMGPMPDSDATLVAGAAMILGIVAINGVLFHRLPRLRLRVPWPYWIPNAAGLFAAFLITRDLEAPSWFVVGVPIVVVGGTLSALWWSRGTNTGARSFS